MIHPFSSLSQKKSEDGDSYKFYELFPEEKQDIHVYCSFSLYL